MTSIGTPEDPPRQRPRMRTRAVDIVLWLLILAVYVVVLTRGAVL